MKEFKGTKGEWCEDREYFQTEDFGIDGVSLCSWITIRAEGKTIAEAKGSHYDVPNEECLANARLIASAVDLLEALQAMLIQFKNIDKNGIAKEQAQKAINKALGE